MISRIIGRSITLDGNSYQVVGVMPKGFDFPLGRDNIPADLWITVAILREKQRWIEADDSAART
mgnify:CR=1 FL=1